MRRAAPVLSLILLAACAGGDREGSPDAQGVPAAGGGGVDITGAGATFPYPLYSKWFYEYDRTRGVRINYQSIGSGGGIRQLSEGTVDFGASDAPMSDEEMARARGTVLHFPTVIGAVAVTYNLPGARQTLRFTPDVLADVFLGRITKWNDPRIVELNPLATLPSTDVLVVHRSDGSGTTFIFTDYLSSVSEAWSTGPGKGKEVGWPVGLGGKGNEGVAGQIKQTPGSIGYVELAYAHQNDLPVAELRNRAGEFVKPSLEGATAAAAGVAGSLPPDTDFRISIVNAPGQRAYPISSFTWILVYRRMDDAETASKLIDFIRWALGEGQNHAAALDYAPLPANMVRLELEQLKAVEHPGHL